jgi:type IV secretory pathway VirB4 component
MQMDSNFTEKNKADYIFTFKIDSKNIGHTFISGPAGTGMSSFTSVIASASKNNFPRSRFSSLKIERSHL